METSVNAANQVVSVGADIAFDADPKFLACVVRFQSSSVPTTLPTVYDVYPLAGRHDGLSLHDALPIFLHSRCRPGCEGNLAFVSGSNRPPHRKGLAGSNTLQPTGCSGKLEIGRAHV